MDSLAAVSVSPVQPQASSIDNLGLRDARETERLGRYFAGLWKRREYAWYVSASELRSRQINSLLGNLWHLLNPMLQISVFYVIFGLVLQTDRGVDNFVGFLTVGIFVFQFFQKSVTLASKSLTKNRNLMQSISFPRALLPLTSALAEALAVLPAYFVMLLVVSTSGETPSAVWLLIVPFYFVQVLLNAGAALIAARAASHIPDIQQALPFVFRLGFYASGVLFNVNAYLEGNPWAIVFELNPAYCLIEVNRGILLDGTSIDWSLAATAAIWAVVLALGGIYWFRRAEDTYGEG